MHWQFPVASWYAWPPGKPAAVGGTLSSTAACVIPEVKFVPALLRRRLGTLARIALAVAEECAQDRGVLRTVYASRHGDLLSSLEMQADLAAGQPLSPTTFSQSVHNAAVGVRSILHADRQAATAIAAGEETLAYALLEASAQFAAEPEVPVLLVYADMPAPPPYAPYIKPQEEACAIALLLAQDASRRIECTAKPTAEAASRETQAHALARCLREDGRATWSDGGKRWSWTCRAG